MQHVAHQYQPWPQLSKNTLHFKMNLEKFHGENLPLALAYLPTAVLIYILAHSGAVAGRRL